MAQVLGLLDAREHDPGPRRLTLEVLDRRAQRALEDVVREHHAHLVARDEVLREPERVRDPARLLLVAVREEVEAVLAPVPEQAEELAGVRPAGDEHELGDPGLHERLDGVRDHRSVPERQQVLVRDPRERMETGAGSAGEDDALHAADPSGCAGMY
jgi:hypothetical protein